MALLPHIRNTKVGVDKQDPMHSSIFEVSFTLPTAIAGNFTEDSETLSQQVTNVAGLDVLQKTVEAGSQ